MLVYIKKKTLRISFYFGLFPLVLYYNIQFRVKIFHVKINSIMTIIFFAFEEKYNTYCIHIVSQHIRKTSQFLILLFSKLFASKQDRKNVKFFKFRTGHIGSRLRQDNKIIFLILITHIFLQKTLFLINIGV